VSKAAKTKRALERRKIKSSRKAIERAKYESYKASGNNKKSKRSKLNSKRAKKVRVNRHAGPCNNVSCLKCFNLAPKQKFPKATKPWKTSAEKLAFRNQKLLAERQET
jgi:hypothetical protein